jgi:hypothetical protein
VSVRKDGNRVQRGVFRIVGKVLLKGREVPVCCPVDGFEGTLFDLDMEASRSLAI